MILIDLHKYIEEHKEYKLVCSLVEEEKTNNIIKELKQLSIKYKYKYKLKYTEYDIKTKTGILIKEIQIS